MASTKSTASSSGSSSAAPERGPARPGLVLADANAFFLPLAGPIDLEAEVRRLLPAGRLAVAASTVAELDRLVERGVPAAGAARELARRLPRVPSRGRGDAGLLELARACGAWVITGDRRLQQELARAGVGALVPRQRSGLAIRRPRQEASATPPRRRATVKNGPRVASGARRRSGGARR